MGKAILIMIMVVFFIIFVALLSKLEGVTTGSTVLNCEVSCSSNIDCDDENECTKDNCMYPNSCESICYHSLIDNCRN